MASGERTIDLLDGDMYASGPYETYAWLRDHAPLYWDPANELWGVSRYDDIVEIEKRSDTFINSDREKGGYRPNLPADSAIIGLDDPLHRKRRSLVSRRFTPGAVGRLEGGVRDRVTKLLDAVEAHGGAGTEIVAELAAPLPAMMIGQLLGFSEDAWPDLQSWSERTVATGGGPRYFTEDGIGAAMEFAQAAADLYAVKRACPVDDIMSVWASAQVDGVPLDVEAVISDGLLLLDGGAETTRTVIARTLLNLADHPEAWELLQGGAPIDVAVEEFIRFVTPIHNMCRVAVEEVAIAGGVVPKGHQVILLYGSANRDPEHFTAPDRFDVLRTPNPHIAFGFGTHFCLGTALARLEIRVFFEELVRRVRALRLTPGTASVEMPNAFVYGLRSAHLDLQFA